MNIIKKLLVKISKTTKETIIRFPLTIGAIVIITTFLSICVDTKVNNDNIITNTIIVGAIFVCGTLFSESYFEKWIYRTITYVVAAVISIVLTITIHPSDFEFITSINVSSSEATRIAVGYGIILILLSIYKILKDSKLKFEEYLLKVFSNLFMSWITYFILNIGISLISLIFIELILDGNGGEFILRVQIIMAGYFFINSLVYSISSVKDKNVNTFIRGVVNYVLLPLVTIAMAIIYLYIIKIIVLRNMPSNVIFRILAGIFIFGFPIWNMASNFSENKITLRVSLILPYAFCPFMILEIYSVGVRILNYGLTPLRYACTMFILFQIIALIFTFIKNKRMLSYLFLAVGILVLIVFISPLNYEKVTGISQQHVLTKYYIKGADLSKLKDDEKQKIIGAYDFLQLNPKYSMYIPSYVMKSEIENLRSEIDYPKHYSYDEEVPREKYYNYENSNIDIDVSNYSRIANVKLTEYEGDITKLKLKNSKDVEVEVNFEDLINESINESTNLKSNESIDLNSGVFEMNLENNNIVKIDDKKDLYIYLMRITYDPTNKGIENLSISAYVLFK